MSTVATAVARPVAPPLAGLRGAAAFTVLTLLGALATMAVAAQQGADLDHLDDAPVLAQLALFGTAFVPGAVALGLGRAAGDRAGRGLGRAGLRRALGTAWALPVLCCAAAYGPAWASGLATLDAGTLAVAPLALTLGVVAFAPLALGEELGWRGWLLPRLLEATDPPRAALTTGAVWTAYHLPMVCLVTGGTRGVPLGLAVAAFSLTTLALSVPLALLRMRTGSLWPCVVLHATWNAAVYLVADPATGTGAAGAWATGETGVGLAVATPIVCGVWLRCR